MEMKNLAFEVCLFILRCDILHAVTFLDMGQTALLPFRTKACCGFLSLLKIHRSRPGPNSRTLG
jgi:hypothetical protein